MATSTVTFTYFTGLVNPAFAAQRAVLAGSWDAGGRHSHEWSRSQMERFVAKDGGIAFRATVELDSAEAGRTFQWGVALFLANGSERWAIPTETNDLRAQLARFREFRFGGAPQHEVYHLTHCRWLGANKRHSAAGTRAHFGVWAPNALKVEVVFARVWDANDPAQTPTRDSLPIERVSGGYIGPGGEGIDPALPVIPLARGVGGVWESTGDEPALRDFAHLKHRAYLYRVTQEDGFVAYRTDLYSRCQIGYGAENPIKKTPIELPYLGPVSRLDGTVSCSTVVDPDEVTRTFEEQERVWPERDTISAAEFWSDEFTDRTVPARIEDLIIYELHVGALGFGNATAGTLADAMALLDHLESLHVNAVELLPMCEFGGAAENWGYATSHFFAIEYSEGGRDQYKHFVKECHRRGMAVIMDVVYNHYAHDAERAEYHYDSSLPENNLYYWYEGRSGDYQLHGSNATPAGAPFPEGGYVDNMSTAWAPRYHAEMVRKMFISSAVALLEEFHVDGLRLDQTTSIHAYNVLKADGRPVGTANAFGAKLLRELGRTIRLVKPGTMLMAEDHSDWDQVTRPAEEDGMGFDARWYADFCHHLAGDTDKGSDYAKLIYRAAAEGAGATLQLDYFAGALRASADKKVVYCESHDEAGNSKGPFHDPNSTDSDKHHTSHRSLVVAANGAPLVGDTRHYAEARCRYQWGVTVLSAGTPMLLFGEECGAVQRFKYNAVLPLREDLLGLAQREGHRLFTFYREINRLRLNHPALRSRNLEVVHVHNHNRVIAFRRWEGDQRMLVVTSLKDAPFSEGYTLRHEHLERGRWREVFNSDSARYGGNNAGNAGSVLRCDEEGLTVVIPFCSVLVFAFEGP